MRRTTVAGLALMTVLATTVLAGCANEPVRPRDAGRGDGSGRALAVPSP